MGRALAKEIHVLRVVWPGHQPNKLTDLAETIYLDGARSRGRGGPIAAPVAATIALPSIASAPPCSKAAGQRCW